MASLNKVFLIGRLGKDPETRYTPSGAAVCKFSMATEESWKDKSGEQQKKTEWHNIVAWNKTGELCQEYLRKGSLVFIEGKIQSREWETQSGEKRRMTEINALAVQFLTPKAEPALSQPAQASSWEDSEPVQTMLPQGEEITDDDIPF